jgi:hypothetical protein
MTTFRTFFHGNISGLEITRLKSFVDYRHRILVFAYDDAGPSPAFEWADAAEVLPGEQVFLYRSGPGQGSAAAFANRFRYLVS